MAVATCGAPAAAQNAPGGAGALPPAPELRIDYFGAEKGYAVGTGEVRLLCVVRNVGSASLPPDSARVRIDAIAGLDYTTGETRPVLPGLSPNQAVAYRWRLAPADSQGTLIAAVLVEKNVPAGVSGGVSVTAPSVAKSAAPGGSLAWTAPAAVVCSIPHFENEPHLSGNGTSTPAPFAEAGQGGAWVGNDKVVFRAAESASHLPILSLGARTGNDWQRAALGLSGANVFSAEDGQRAWWEAFRWRETSVRRDRGAATLTLQGTVGSNWQAEISVTARPDTCVLEGRLRLTARRVVRVFGVRLPTFRAETEPLDASLSNADGAPLPIANEPPAIGDELRLAAAHRGNITTGIAWTANSPLPGWRAVAMPAGDAQLAPILGMEWLSNDRGEIVVPGATIEYAFHLFAFAPSDTVRDATRFAIP